ncbi:hypothetical protein CONCODRAFT_73352 [Conidiobolus coronatus NRRL 28638]|uniref:F-box domain-containing protein n=1 Tax=Conidiobolus coronatus (strain ATCC 28846 / CBS 209.66 / NRRL 28638) TaxID=796925 RepID=A0A137NWA0_CONC2|nr:hypothetical protein CONCODRAFT_73352 [Conidiobolus coronatus NRRL 28638]|eukprot:KXN66909.1 hypothetical protein CONCODRAFT_73352 [Conidiobolus coronatus NRRL 28638]
MSISMLTKQMRSINGDCDWEFLPELVVDCLGQYLVNGDLIELSKASSWYRAQLKKVILKSLTIFRCQKALLDSYGVSLDKKKKFKRVFDDMKADLEGNHTLVKELKIFATIPIYFINDLVKLFDSVNRVSIIGEGNISLRGLIPIIIELRKLKHIKLSLNDLIKNSDMELLVDFSKKLNTIEMDIFWDYNSKLYSPAVSGFSFNNLTKLTIFYLNTLTSFPTHLPSLVHVELLDFSVPALNNAIHVKFLESNQQLKTLIISGRILNNDIINLILGFKKLKYLEIIHSLNTQVLNNMNMVNNHSIQYLKLYENFQSKGFELFLTYCKSLQVVEFDNLKYQSEFEIELDNYRRINQLILKNRPWCKNPPLPKSILDLFNIALLINWQEISKFKQKTLINLEGWSLREYDYCKPREYYISRD